MTKREFLEKLRAALAEDLGSAAVQEQVAFYRQYIEDEVRKGRSEEPERQSRTDYREDAHIHVFGFDTWWKKLLLILGVVGILLLVIAVIGGIFSLLLPILVPLVLISLIFRLLDGRK